MFSYTFRYATPGKFLADTWQMHSFGHFASEPWAVGPFTLEASSETVSPGEKVAFFNGNGDHTTVFFVGMTPFGPAFTFGPPGEDDTGGMSLPPPGFPTSGRFLVVLSDDENPVPPGIIDIDPDDPFILCFFPGTRLLTPGGEVAVEDLRPGDLVVTADGRSLPIRWIGRRTVHSFFADPLRSLPVRIAAGALGDGLPRRDLLLSPGHAVALGPLLANAAALVNGTSIRRLGRHEVPERFCWYHIELDEHALLLAEGAPAESLDLPGLAERFDNAAERRAILGADALPGPALEMPRAITARQLPPRERQRLAAIAAELGYAPAARAA